MPFVSIQIDFVVVVSLSNEALFKIYTAYLAFLCFVYLGIFFYHSHSRYDHCHSIGLKQLRKDFLPQTMSHLSLLCHTLTSVSIQTGMLFHLRTILYSLLSP